MNAYLAAVLAVCTLIPSVHCADNSVAWCYNEPSCNDTTWPDIAPKYCNGSRQSPINIVSGDATGDSKLTAFNFQNYDSTTALANITNTGKTIKVELDYGVKVSGGGLSEEYDSLQFHLHWGNGSSSPGSEHTVDGKRYSMELHIVNSKSKYNRNTSEAVQDSTGLAALGFFVEAMSGNETGQPSSWKNLTSYLANIKYSKNTVPLAPGISLDDLLGDVDRTKFYRYLGSLTTPSCNEAVVWTVFKEPIKVSKDLIDLFSTLHIGNMSSPLMTDVFRNIQAAQPVTTQPSDSTSSASTSSYSLGLMALGLALGRG